MARESQQALRQAQGERQEGRRTEGAARVFLFAFFLLLLLLLLLLLFLLLLLLSRVLPSCFER